MARGAVVRARACVCVCARVRARVRARACVRACARACARAFVRARARAFECARAHGAWPQNEKQLGMGGI